MRLFSPVNFPWFILLMGRPPHIKFLLFAILCYHICILQFRGVFIFIFSDFTSEATCRDRSRLQTQLCLFAGTSEVSRYSGIERPRMPKVFWLYVALRLGVFFTATLCCPTLWHPCYKRSASFAVSSIASAKISLALSGYISIPSQIIVWKLVSPRREHTDLR